MKKYILTLSAAFLLFSNPAKAQDISQSQVPSVILNNFKTSYPKASDIDWEMDGDLYKVDFEMNWNDDYKIWYSADGKVAKKEEEISEAELPKTVKDKINLDFKNYSLDDIKKITTNTETVYKMELKSWKKDWDVVLDANGKILSQKED